MAAESRVGDVMFPEPCILKLQLAEAAPVLDCIRCCCCLSCAAGGAGEGDGLAACDAGSESTVRRKRARQIWQDDSERAIRLRHVLQYRAY